MNLESEDEDEAEEECNYINMSDLVSVDEQQAQSVAMSPEDTNIHDYLLGLFLGIGSVCIDQSRIIALVGNLCTYNTCFACTHSQPHGGPPPRFFLSVHSPLTPVLPLLPPTRRYFRPTLSTSCSSNWSFESSTIQCSVSRYSQVKSLETVLCLAESCLPATSQV